MKPQLSVKHVGNDDRDEIEYRLSVQQRRIDAKTRMKQTAKLINGEIRGVIGGEIVGAMNARRVRKHAL